jgi:hypothetical protein
MFSHRMLMALCLAASCLQSGSLDAGEESATGIDFNREIRPILSENCFFCHGPDAKQRKAGLRLDTRDGLFRSRAGKVVVEPGKPDSSELIRRITHGDPDERMPPAESRQKLDERQIELIRHWIEQGAQWQQHWSYVVPLRPPLPRVTDAAWPANAMDRFVLARIDAERLRPSPDADPRTLVRRVSFDLLGLPPNPEDVTAFLADPGPDRYERFVDRLLASPHFGERMAVYWLDLVRYADTVGYHGDQEHAISPYRDYVIQAFNDNMPFDRFTTEQLAGDLLPDPTLQQRIATGYNRVLQTSHEGGVQQKEYLTKYAADRVRNFSSVWLGATMGCAECHDHKYDPYTQRDFYSLEAFFADVDDYRTFKGGDVTPTKREPEIDIFSPPDRERLELLADEAIAVEKQLQALSAGSSDVPSLQDAKPDRDSLDRRLAELKKEIESVRQRARRTMVTETTKPRATRVLPRGDWLDESGEIVQPAVPTVFRQVSQPDRATRLDLAQWLVAPDNPLTARVFVNRLWKLFFGKGLSARLDDLGARGEPPVHPELLDWLAVEFVSSGWDVKHLVRLMVTSHTYRQSSLETAELRRRDPENRLFARQARPRLDAEFIRDNALATSGLLIHAVGGRSVRPYQPTGYYQHLNFPKRDYQPDSGEQQYRRGVYTHWQRAYLHPMLKAFDAPSREECTAERPVSNTPQASLVLLNDPTFIEAARVFAARIMREGGSDPASRIRRAWTVAVGRDASEREAALLRQLFDQDLADYRADRAAAEQLLGSGQSPVPPELDAAELAAWTSVARALFNLSEVITRN